MCKNFPVKKFEFSLGKQAATFVFMPDDGPERHILEVDLEYPKVLHDAHSGYPPCPELAVIKPADLSLYTVSLAEKLGVKSNSCRKLQGMLKNKALYALPQPEASGEVGNEGQKTFTRLFRSYRTAV